MLRKNLLILVFPVMALSQSLELAPVVSKTVSRTTELPGELQPFLSVALHAKVAGYVDRITVDRGSEVKQGEILAELSAPEIQAQIVEAESKVQTAAADALQAQAQLAAVQSTYDRLKKAAATPGAIAGNDLVLGEKQVEAAQAMLNAKQQAGRTAQAAVETQRQMQSYLRISAPFDGMVTDRLIHPGALVGPSADPVLFVIQQISRLRLVVAVPEEDVGSIVSGAKAEFNVPAYPERAYSGAVARIAHALDQKTRTMAVELDVANRDGSLSPGMYTSVKWPIRRSRPALFVPRTSVVTTTERTFVVRNRNGSAEWVDVRKGSVDGDSVEVAGNLKPGDMVVRRATDEIREGTPLK